MKKIFCSLPILAMTLCAFAANTNPPGIISLTAPATPSVETFAKANGVAASAQPDLTAAFSDLKADPTAQFREGVVFQPRFGTNTTLTGRRIIGQNNGYSLDGKAWRMTNGLSIPLPSALSNVTVVVMYRGNEMRAGMTNGGTVWSLGNSSTKSSIELSVLNGQAFVWENRSGAYYNNRDASGFTNVLATLEIASYTYTDLYYTQAKWNCVALSRDASGNWWCYKNTIPGKFGFSVLTNPLQFPTNAGGGFDTLYLGWSGVTNTAFLQSQYTNLNIASVFVFATTNYSAVKAGYKAAVDLWGTKTVDLTISDSLLSPENPDGGVANIDNYPGFFLDKKHPDHLSLYQTQGSTTLAQLNSIFFPGAGAACLTNLPDGIETENVNLAVGLNDVYASSASDATVFQSATNAIWTLYSMGAPQIKYIDIPQIATNASSYTYSLPKETNAYNANWMIRTNPDLPIAQYIPRRDFCPQSVLQTNGLFSNEGVHPMTRTNYAFSQQLADLIDSHAPLGVYTTTNGVVVP